MQLRLQNMQGAGSGKVTNQAHLIPPPRFLRLRRPLPLLLDPSLVLPISGISCTRGSPALAWLDYWCSSELRPGWLSASPHATLPVNVVQTQVYISIFESRRLLNYIFVSYDGKNGLREEEGRRCRCYERQRAKA
jgi:hypothetical protein